MLFVAFGDEGDKMLKVEEYIKQLEITASKIESYFDSTQIRESGVASFIFAEKGNRATEIYQSENGVSAEFWKNEITIREEEKESYEEIEKIVIDWITRV